MRTRPLRILGANEPESLNVAWANAAAGLLDVPRMNPVGTLPTSREQALLIG
jgi:hypothetical protein